MRIAIAGLLIATGTLSADDIKKDVKGDVKLINSIEGSALYKAYCSSCHGQDAKGGGPVQASLKVPPPDLTRIAMRRGGVFPLKEVSGIIAGQVGVTAHGSREMPVWGPIFSQVTVDQDLGRVRIDNLARYLRDIQVK